MSSNPLDRCRVGSDGTFRHSVSDNSKDQLGRAGEEEAVFFLEERGFRVIAKNFRIENTEIDIVAQDGRTLVIAEVKTRRTGDFGAPSEAIKRPKMQRLVRAADLFAKRRRLRGVPIRFDIIDIVWPENEPPRIKHIADAFQVNDLFR